MPPIMGAGAFILATWTNIPYVRVASAAIIPALLYYVALLAAIHFRAGRMGLEPAQREQADGVLDRLHLLLPLAAIVTRKAAAAELTVAAALTGSRQLFVEALLADGSVSDPEIARKMGNELLETHRQYLPNFFE